MVARVRRPGSTPKLVSTWTGPRRFGWADKVHVYGVQNMVKGEVKDVHEVSLRFYADKDLVMMAVLKEVFQHAIRVVQRLGCAGIRRFRPQGGHKNSPSRRQNYMTPYMVGKLAPNPTHSTRELVKHVPDRGYFRVVPSENGNKVVTSPPPPPLYANR